MKQRTKLIAVFVGILVGVFVCSSLGSSALAQTQEDAPQDESPLVKAPPRHQIDAGAFIGGNIVGNGLELGNAYHDDQVPTSGFLLGLRGSYLLVRDLIPGMSLRPQLSVELETKLAISYTEGNREFMRASYAAPVLGWRAHAVLSVMPERALTPFVLLGLGGETAFSSSPFVDSVDSDAALHWGAGARYQIAPSYGVRADIRHGITAGRTSFASNTLELHVGFVYRFGMETGAGASRSGKEPDEKPDHTLDTKTMPTTTDRDEDGFLDEVDQCPDEAESVNHIEDDDGCPEPDADGDELPDVVDECPEDAEDIDGFEDLDGCPDRDNDKDGRSDAIDACPQEPEVLNGFEDEDGCPDEVPKAVLDGLASIRFLPNSVQLKRAKKQLDSVLALLNEHPSLNLVISGHTDDKERKAAQLSLDRANAVKAFLVSQGIDDTRLATEGHGADRPEASNRTKLGKARNRRVDFDLVPGPAEILDPTQTPTQTPPQTPPPTNDPAAGEDASPAPDSGPQPDATPDETKPEAATAPAPTPDDTPATPPAGSDASE